MDENNISEEISSHKHSAEVIDHTCDDNEKKYSIHKKKRMLHQLVPSMQLTTYIYNIMAILSKNIMHYFCHQRTMRIYLFNQNMIKKNEEFLVIKT